MFLFYTSLETPENQSFLVFLGGINRNIGQKWVNTIRIKTKKFKKKHSQLKQLNILEILENSS